MTTTVSVPAKALTAPELQKILDEKRGQFDRAMSNLGDLMSRTTYKLLTDPQVFANLVGASRDRVRPAIGALNEIWSLLPQVQELLDKAAEMHKNLSRFFQEKDLAQIQELLCGQSIKVKQEIPFAQRSLLDPNVKVTTFSIEEVLNLIDPAFTSARDVVVEIEAIFAELFDKVAQHEAAVNTASVDAASLDATLVPEAEALKKRVAALRGQVSTDPIGAQADFDQSLLPDVQALERKLSDVRKMRGETETQVKAARTLLSTLRATYANALAAQEERVLKVTGINIDTIPRLFAESVFVDAERGLEPWLARLENSLAEGKWRAVSVGIGNWSVQVADRQTQAMAALNANLAPVNLRRELRGRLDALKAKATQLKLVEKPKLAALSREADTMLYTRPTDLKRAEDLVQQYAAAMLTGDLDSLPVGGAK